MNGRLTDSPLAAFLSQATREGGVDFHLHSSCSDGLQSPGQLVAQAVANRLRAFALTDHDSMAGIPEARRTLKALEIPDPPVLIPGVECSARYQEREVHILGYFQEDQPVAMLDYLRDLAEERQERNLAMMAKLNDLGFPVRPEDLEEYGRQGTVYGRVHMAQWLVDRAGFSSIDQAFRQLLGQEKPAFVLRKKRQVSEVAGVIRRAGGLAVLAHPQQYGWCEAGREEELEGNFLAMKEAGIQGIECFHGDADQREASLMQETALAVDLICTAGSDSHGREDLHAPMFGPESRAFAP